MAEFDVRRLYWVDEAGREQIFYELPGDRYSIRLIRRMGKNSMMPGRAGGYISLTEPSLSVSPEKMYFEVLFALRDRGDCEMYAERFPEGAVWDMGRMDVAELAYKTYRDYLRMTHGYDDYVRTAWPLVQFDENFKLMSEREFLDFRRPERYT